MTPVFIEWTVKGWRAYINGTPSSILSARLDKVLHKIGLEYEYPVVHVDMSMEGIPYGFEVYVTNREANQ